MKNVKSKRAAVTMRAIDEANMDLHFVEAFVDLLKELTKNAGTLEIRTSMIAAISYEAGRKIKNLNKFMNSIPLNTQETKAA